MSTGPLSLDTSSSESITVFTSPVSTHAFEGADGWALVRYSGQPIGEVIWMHGDVTIGRSTENTVQLFEPEISRCHVNILRHSGGEMVQVMDLGSTNGTFLNGVRLAPHRAVAMREGDVLRMGPHVFKVRCLDPMELAFHEAMIQQTTVDGLTGLANRATVLSFLDKQAELARRHRRPLSLVICDLDHFKAINDQYGHATGDEVLQLFGRLVQGRIRASDQAGRIGGEEFVVILPETPLAEASKVAEALRDALASEGLVVMDGGEILRVTASLGVAQLRGHDHGGGSLLARADRCLYQAKALGRNRVFSERP